MPAVAELSARVAYVDTLSVAFVRAGLALKLANRVRNSLLGRLFG
jgi:hypothetical protein